jgi:hypothetical protein
MSGTAPPPSPAPSKAKPFNEKITEKSYNNLISILTNKSIPDKFKTKLLDKIKEKDVYDRLIKVISNKNAFDYEKRLNR